MKNPSLLEVVSQAIEASYQDASAALKRYEEAHRAAVQNSTQEAWALCVIRIEQYEAACLARERLEAIRAVARGD